MRLRIHCLTAAALLLALLLFLCAAQADGEISVSAEMGYENTVSYLAAMPLRVRIRNAGGDADLTVAVNLTRSQYEYDRCEYPVFLAGGAARWPPPPGSRRRRWFPRKPCWWACSAIRRSPCAI